MNDLYRFFTILYLFFSNEKTREHLMGFTPDLIRVGQEILLRNSDGDNLHLLILYNQKGTFLKDFIELTSWSDKTLYFISNRFSDSFEEGVSEEDKLRYRFLINKKKINLLTLPDWSELQEIILNLIHVSHPENFNFFIASLLKFQELSNSGELIPWKKLTDVKYSTYEEPLEIFSKIKTLTRNISKDDKKVYIEAFLRNLYTPGEIFRYLMQILASNILDYEDDILLQKIINILNKCRSNFYSLMKIGLKIKELI